MTTASELHSLAWRSALVLAVRVTGAGFGFLFSVFLARRLGADGAGVFALALTVMIISSVIVRLGMDTALLKLASAAIARNEGDRLRSIVRRGVFPVVILAATASAAILALADELAVDFFGSPAVAPTLRVFALVVPAYAVFNLFGELLRASGRYALSSFVQGAALPTLTLSTLLLAGTAVDSPVTAAEIYLGGSLTVLALAYAAWRPIAGATGRSGEPVSRAELMHNALPLYGGSVAVIVMTWSDTLLLGHWANAADVGIYNAAARTALLANFVLLAINTIVAPRLSALASLGRHREMALLVRQSTFLSALATLPVLIAFLGWGDRILALFGEGFSAGWTAMIILALGQFVNAITGPVGYLLTMCGHQHIEGRVSVGSAILGVLLSLLLIPLWGVAGAASANALAVATCNITRLILAYRKTGILVLPIPFAIRARPSDTIRNVRRPNFFLIGAPKCGTTAMSEYLRSHPQIFFSEPKEPDFFSSDINVRYKVRNSAQYEGLYARASDHHSAIGEGSANYLRSTEAIPRILEYSSNAKFVVMLRNPIDLAHSWHAEARYNHGETEPDFERAWRLQDERRAGRSIPAQCPDVQLLMYREVGAIGSQLERAIRTIPDGRLHIVFFDDFRRDTKAVYEGVLTFLGLDSDQRTSFPVINESKQVRSVRLMEVSHFVAKIKQRLGLRSGTGLLEAINVSRRPRPALSPAFRRELAIYFQSEVEIVQRLTGRDLSGWLKAP